jgi:alpha-L-fucosidase
MWDTKESDYNIMNSPFKRDVVKELAEACKKAGIRFGAYYCIADFYHPDFPITSAGGKAFRREKSDIESYNRFLLAQITELVKNYGPLVTLWFDDPREFKGRGNNIIKLARELQPDILINNRTGDGGDYNTSEQRIGKSLNDGPWETCMTIGRQWAWKPNDEMKSLKDCLQTLVACAGGDGNLLFNVGPMPDGRIEPRQVERLKEMGAWLAKNGVAIYGTRGGPWKSTKAVASTRKGNQVFLHVLRPGDNKIQLPDLPVKVKSATLLDGREVKFAQQDSGLTLELDPAILDPIDTIVRLELSGSTMDIPWIALDPGIKGSASSVAENGSAKFAAQFAFDNDSATRWMAGKDAKQAWVAADFGKPITIERVRIMEDVEARAVEGAVGEGVGRVQKFEFQYRVGDEWKTIFAGDKLGRWFQQKFEPVEAREFRLNILEATDSPGIADIEFIEH